MQIGHRVAAFVWANLGHCPRCIGSAFRFAAAAWLAAFVTLTVLEQPIVANLLLIVAGLITTLWVAHLVAYATKVTVGVPRSTREAARAVAGRSENRSRRELFPAFARTLAFVALATSIPMFAKAQSGGTYKPCGMGGLRCVEGGPLNQCCCCDRQGCSCRSNQPNREGKVHSCIGGGGVCPNLP